jgi:hypothetical protein
MPVKHELRLRLSAIPPWSGLPRTPLRSSRYGVGPTSPAAPRPAARAPRPQVGDSVRVWDYVDSQWIEGSIETIESGYRILVHYPDGAEETFGWYLALHEGVWVEDVVGVGGTKK